MRKVGIAVLGLALGGALASFRETYRAPFAGVRPAPAAARA